MKAAITKRLTALEHRLDDARGQAITRLEVCHHDHNGAIVATEYHELRRPDANGGKA